MLDVQPGRMIAGHLLKERIGEGHFGEVWKAEFQGRTVAVKIFNPNLKASLHRQEALAQYALGRLSGDEGRFFPHIEAIELDNDIPFLRMELVEGRPLERHVAERPVSLDQRLALGRMLLQSLAIVHRHGFVHGDLSPSNVLVSNDGSIKLIDVGYGAVFNESVRDVERSGDSNDQSMGVASPLYAAPERFKSAFLEGCGKQSDIFSFGKVLYRLVTGEAPFVIKPLSKKFPALGAAWDDFLFRCLEESPEARFADASVALADYERIYRPEAAAGEFRAECPECKARLSIPGGWAGERFACRGCSMTLEVLFYDETSRHASTAVVADVNSMRPEIEFVEEDAVLEILDTRARKFCPSCGRNILVEAKKCPHCRVWVDEAARRVAAPRPNAVASREPDAVWLQGFFTVGAYFLYWIPGAILNWHFLTEARQAVRRTGQRPAGMGLLEFSMILGVYVPLALLGAMMVIVFFRSAARVF